MATLKTEYNRHIVDRTATTTTTTYYNNNDNKKYEKKEDKMDKKKLKQQQWAVKWKWKKKKKPMSQYVLIIAYWMVLMKACSSTDCHYKNHWKKGQKKAW